MGKAITWGVVLYFAITWTLGVVRHEQYRLKSTVASIALWWIDIILVFFGSFTVYHLSWVMPLTLFVAGSIGTLELFNPPSSVIRIFVKSFLILAIPVGVLIWWSLA